MMQLPPATCALLAAGFDWLEALLPFLFVAFWILSQVFAVFRRLQGGRPPGEARRPPAVPRFDPARERERLRQPAGDAADPRIELDRQIADFLREVTGENRQRPAAEPTVVRGAADESRPQPRRPAGTELERRGPQPRRAGQSSRQERERGMKKTTAAPRKPAVPSAEAVPVAKPMHAEHEAAEVSVARHVQGAFSHELAHLQGTLAHEEPQAGGKPPPRPTQAEELVHLLRNPATIRQVILLREVIDRPVDRW